jgi:hypothetical protein
VPDLFPEAKGHLPADASTLFVFALAPRCGVRACRYFLTFAPSAASCCRAPRNTSPSA